MRERFSSIGLGLMALGLAACSVSEGLSAGDVPGDDKSAPTSIVPIAPSTPDEGGGFIGGVDAMGQPVDPSKSQPFGFACDSAAPITLSMSADDSNSMGSPGYARDMLNSGKAPDPALIRTYEFLNYYNAGYEAANPGELSIIPQVEENPAMPGEFRLQIGVQSPPPDSNRRAMTVTLVVDTSQSMAGKGLANAKAVLSEIALSLRPDDRVSLVTLDTDAAALVDGQVISSSADIELVRGAASKLTAGGGADLQGGLVRGYALAHEHYLVGGMNRLVFITDGRANPKEISKGFIGEHAQQGDDKGIYLVGVGTGPAEGYNDALLNELTDYGRGAYVYIDSEAEAKKMFSTRFNEVMDIAARSVAVSVAVPEYFSLQRYYGEFIATPDDPPKPQHLAPGDAMVFNMTFRSTCDTQISGSDKSISVKVEWETPITQEKRVTEKTANFDELHVPDPAPIKKANAVIAYAEALKSLDAKRLAEAKIVVEGVLNSTGDPDLEEIAGLLASHPALAGATKDP